MRKFENKVSVCIVALAAAVIFNAYITNQREEVIIDSINTIGRVLPTLNSSQQASKLKGEMLYGYVKQKIGKLRLNLDKTSNEVLDYVEKAIAFDEVRRSSCFEKQPFEFPLYHQQYRKDWEETELTEVSKKYVLSKDLLCPEVFYFHHGLKFANQKIKDYIKNKDILDCGAFIGDSVLVLKDYNPRMIYSYEFSRANIKSFHKIMRENGIASGYKLIDKALGDKPAQIRVDTLQKFYSGERLRASNKGYLVDVVTIDEEAKKHKFNVGFIKIDVEGEGMNVIKGAINTIKQQRPVMAIAVYHNSEELFGIKPFLESKLKNYVYEFQFQYFHPYDFNELILFCYPKEIVK